MAAQRIKAAREKWQVKSGMVMSRAWQRNIAKQCMKKHSVTGVARYIRAAVLPYLPKDSHWYREFRKLANGLAVGEPVFPVLNLDGNVKLPFASFSTLPEFTCPGAGACLSWCYSFTSWRYPAAFCRQLQNTLLLKHTPEVVADAFLALPEGLDVRLYVDGDFKSAERVAYWMALIARRPDLQVYGYSKSWAQLLEYDRNGGVWPANYVLNLSSGSKYGADYERAMEALPITRGRFVAVEIDGAGIEKGFARYANAEYHKRVREAAQEQYGLKAFSCPGTCGSCTIGGHMCGQRDKQVLVAIGVH